MATAAVQYAPGNALGQVVEPLVQDKQTTKHDVTTELYYYKEPEDGSPPAPYYVGYGIHPLLNMKQEPSNALDFSKPDNVERPAAPQTVVIRDIAGDEDKYTLDSHGFQYVKHESKEKDFLDDAQIKAQYYAETEQLLKDSYAQVISIRAVAVAD